MGKISEASSLSTIDGLVDGLISFSFCMLCLCISDFNSWVMEDVSNLHRKIQQESTNGADINKLWNIFKGRH
jgi:hypothetical protein